MRMIFAPKDESEGAFLISLLEAEEVSVQLWTVKGEGGQTPPQIWLLDDSDFERASEIIQEYMKNMDKPPVEGTPWACGGCGEEHESNFSECWKCGRSRP